MNLAARIDAAPACPVCRGRVRGLFEGLYDDRYGYPDLFTLYRCVDCGHMHIPTNFGPEQLGRLYTDYYPRGDFKFEHFRPEQQATGFPGWADGLRGAAFQWVPPNVRVLDIGCGVGAALAYHQGRGCEAVGIEADANVQPIAKRFGLDIRQGVFDGSQFDSDYFDYVTLDQVAEHVTDPHALMRGVARVLKRGGKAIITTPNPASLGARLFQRKWLNWHVPYHIQFYSPKSLELLSERAGMKLVRIRTLTQSAWQLYQWYHVQGFGQPGERHIFWSSGSPPPPRSRKERLLVKLLTRFQFHRWISRALDALGQGDNYVVILEKL